MSGQDLNIVATLTGVLVADVADFSEDFVFVHPDVGGSSRTMHDSSALAGECGAAGRRCALRSAMRCWRVSVASLRLVSSRKRRDISTASKVLAGVVGMDQFFRADDTDGRIATQEVHRIETGFAGDIDEVLEIPTYEMTHEMDGADGDATRVVLELSRLVSAGRALR